MEGTPLTFTQDLCQYLVGMSAEDVWKKCTPAKHVKNDIMQNAGQYTDDRADDIFKDIRYKTLDWIGCVIGALDKESSRSILEISLEAGGNPHCTAFGLKEKTSPFQAAYSNGILGHTLEYDDVNKVAITHPGAIAIPAALAVAEYCGADFETYAMGVVAGYEVMIRLGAALNPTHYEFWHTTGTCGAFAAAAAASRVLGLDAETMGRALGIAATMASGLTSVFGTDAKLVTVGNAVSAGLKAACLARKGYSVPGDVIEREGGYAQAASRSWNPDYLIPKEDDMLMIQDSYYKIHASCGHTHSALDALQKIKKEHEFTADEVASVSVNAYKKAVELTGRFQCDTELRSKFSMPYCIGAMLVYGETGLMQFTEKVRTDERILALKDKITVEEDAAYTAEYPHLRIEQLTVRLKDGRAWSEKVELPDGKPSSEYIERKYMSLAGLTVSQEIAGAVKDTILNLQMNSSMRECGDRIRGEIGGI